MSMRWGTSQAEATLPGDDLLLHVDRCATTAITTMVPAYPVWPWIAHLGQGRCGFYSYDFLENLLGCDSHSTDRIVEQRSALPLVQRQ